MGDTQPPGFAARIRERGPRLTSALPAGQRVLFDVPSGSNSVNRATALRGGTVTTVPFTDQDPKRRGNNWTAAAELGFGPRPAGSAGGNPLRSPASLDSAQTEALVARIITLLSRHTRFHPHPNVSFLPLNLPEAAYFFLIYSQTLIPQEARALPAQMLGQRSQTLSRLLMDPGQSLSQRHGLLHDDSPKGKQSPHPVWTRSAAQAESGG